MRTDEAATLAASLAGQDLEWLDTLPLAPTPRVPGASRAVPSAGVIEVPVEVDLAADEEAVVLLEQDGLYAWQFDALKTELPAGPGALPRRGVPGGHRQVTFRLQLQTTPPAGAARRGLLSDLIVGRAQAFVFKFAGRFLLGRATALLERKVQPGLVLMDTDDPTAWRQASDFAALDLPEDRPAKILLFVHGTFSSTRGGFGGLEATPWGQTFLGAARANYDAVVGFDHPTLSVDPLTNASDLLRLLSARGWAQSARIDVVCHSRGGITIRSLMEHLLPAARLPVQMDRVVFVGAVNGGTELANPANWRSLIDLYTNLAAGACRAIALFPQGVFASALLGELTKSLGALAKVLAAEAITEQAIPGLAAMEPLGPFITDLNRTQPGQPTPSTCRYYAVTSEFNATLALENAKELPRQLLLAVADGLVDQLMGVANDLVVNTGSMTTIDPQAGTFIQDTLAFGSNGVVYHTNYFLQPQVTNALARWLDLKPLETSGASRHRGGIPLGTTVGLEVPASIDTDIVTVHAQDSGAQALDLLPETAPSYVVVERPYEGRTLRYAFPAEEVWEAAHRAPNEPLINSLGLHETDASPEGEPDALPTPPPAGVRPSARRRIAVRGHEVLGVAEPEVASEPLTDLATQAAQILGQAPPPGGETESIESSDMRLRTLVRRMLPSLRHSPSVACTSLDSVLELAMAASPRRSRRPEEWESAPPPQLSRSTRSLPRSTRGAPTAPQPTPRPVRQGQAAPAPSAPPQPEVAPFSPPTPAPAPVPAAPAGPVTCHFLAEMDDEVVVGETTSVDVTLAREVLQATRAVAAAGVAATVQEDRKLIVELIPKKNFEPVSETRAEIDPPAPGSPQPLIFDIRATTAGEGEVWIRIRQGMQPLVNLALRCRIVTQRTHPPVRRPEEARVEPPSPGPQPLHQLTIFETERGGQRLYQYLLESIPLGLKHTFWSQPFSGNREAFIQAIYEDIEQRWLSQGQDFEQFQIELREVGAGLWDELFPPELQRLLWDHRDEINSILVFSEEPFIPWELVHLKEPGGILPPETRFFGQLGLVRWLYNIGWPTEVLHARPGRCFYVIPDYPHPQYQLPQAGAEVDFLEQRLNATEVEPHAPEVRRILRGPAAFDLLHFACHGVADSGDIARAELLLQGRVEGTNYVTERLHPSVVEQSANLIGPEGNAPMVVLNACQAGRAGYKLTSIGGFSRAFLRKGAGMFVGALWAVGDAPARTFTEKLYDRLLAGDPLAQATVAAREAARQAREATWLAYTVYGNPHAKLGG